MGKKGSSPFVKGCKRRRRTRDRNHMRPARPQHVPSGPSLCMSLCVLIRKSELTCTAVYFSPLTAPCPPGTKCLEDTAVTNTDTNPCPGGTDVLTGGATGQEQVLTYTRRRTQALPSARAVTPPWERRRPGRGLSRAPGEGDEVAPFQAASPTATLSPHPRGARLPVPLPRTHLNFKTPPGETR